MQKKKKKGGFFFKQVMIKCQPETTEKYDKK